MLQPALEEQRRILKQHGDHIDVDVLNEMDVLHSNMTEVLRLFPPLILLMRLVKKSFTVTDSKGRQTVIPKVSWICLQRLWYVKGCSTNCQQRQSDCPFLPLRAGDPCIWLLQLGAQRRHWVTGNHASSVTSEQVHTDAADGPHQL